MSLKTEASIREARKNRKESREAGLKAYNRYKGTTSGSQYVKRSSKARSAYQGSSYTE